MVTEFVQGLCAHLRTLCYEGAHWVLTTYQNNAESGHPKKEEFPPTLHRVHADCVHVLNSDNGSCEGLNCRHYVSRGCGFYEELAFYWIKLFLWQSELTLQLCEELVCIALKASSSCFQLLNMSPLILRHSSEHVAPEVTGPTVTDYRECWLDTSDSAAHSARLPRHPGNQHGGRNPETVVH